jgi:hypothetical protein
MLKAISFFTPGLKSLNDLLLGLLSEHRKISRQGGDAMLQGPVAESTVAGYKTLANCYCMERGFTFLDLKTEQLIHS